MRKAMYNLVK